MRKIPTEWDKVDSIVYESYDMWFTLLHQNQNQKVEISKESWEHVE